MPKSVNPNDILVWVQAGGQMVQLVTTAIGNIQSILAAAGADEAQQKASLAKTHALYNAAITREEQIANPATE
jgi:hypothetical protein